MFFDHQHSKTAIALALGAVLAGCGGGGGGGPSGPSSQLTAACSGTACGAANATTYSGQGVGVWSYTNTTQAEQQIPVALTNLGSKQVTLIYTNNGDASVPMPALTLTPPAATTATAQKSLSAASATVNQIPERIRNFKPRLTAADTQARQSIKPQAAAILPVGSQRSWFVQPGDSRIETRQATLRRQASVPTPTGTRTINVWLEDSEYDAAKVSDAMLDTLVQRFTSGSDAVYPLITGLSGEPWGAHSYGDLIDPDQPLDIVFVNFVPDRTPYGLLGYFWSLNNFKQDPANPNLKYSNQSLSFYMDTETLYLDPAAGMTNQISTLSHEFVHMTNFYRRSVQLSKPGTDYAFDTFLEEMSAMMGEDIVAQRVTPGFNSIASGRVPSWLSHSGFNCDPAAWSADTRRALLRLRRQRQPGRLSGAPVRRGLLQAAAEQHHVHRFAAGPGQCHPAGRRSHAACCRPALGREHRPAARRQPQRLWLACAHGAGLHPGGDQRQQPGVFPGPAHHGAGEPQCARPFPLPASA